MTRPAKFNFISEAALGELPKADNSWRIAIYMTGKNNYTIVFPPDYVEIFEMIGKYFTFFVDTEKKALGWREVKDQTDLSTLKGARQAVISGNSKAVRFGIKKLLGAMNYYPQKSLLDLVVQKYSTPLQEISYVTLPPLEANVSTNGTPAQDSSPEEQEGTEGQETVQTPENLPNAA